MTRSGRVCALELSVQALLLLWDSGASEEKMS